MLWGHPPAFRLQWSKFCLNCKLSGRRANAPWMWNRCWRTSAANQETVMGGSHWDRSNTHCDVITITESYHLLHHFWLIQYWANKKIKAIKAKHDEGTRINFSYFPFSGQKLSHQMHEPICWIQLPAPVPNPQETMFQGCSFQLLSCQIPKEISFIWTMHFFLFKKRKKINIWFQYEGTGINIASLWFFSCLLSLFWPVNRNNGIWLWQGQGWLSW